MAKLARRHVDRHGELEPNPATCHAFIWRHASTITQSPIGRIRSVSSASGHEPVGQHQAQLGVMPADQRLDADDAVVSDVDLGLVDQFELLASFDGAAQPIDQVEPFRRLLAQLRGEVLVGVLARRLGAVHRDVGVAQQFLGVLAVDRVEGDPDAGA